MEIPAKWQVSEDKDIPYRRHQDWEQHQVGGGDGDGGGGNIGHPESEYFLGPTA